MKLESLACLIVCSLSLACGSTPGPTEPALPRLLLIDGENNHAWRETTPLLKAILETRFSVEVWTLVPETPLPGRFQDFEAVVSNYNGVAWPRDMQEAFQEYVHQGGGFVSVHAANNAFPEWEDYNQMIGVGGWGDRDQSHGPYLRLREGSFVPEASPGPGGSHGRRHEFLMIARQPRHPILRGLPAQWMHARDELYDRLRGPAQNLEVLASAFSDPETRGSGEHEPILMTIRYGEGRVFHTTLGHDAQSIRGVGFQETLLRGAEWAATGGVRSREIPTGWLRADGATYRDVDAIQSEDPPWVSLFDGRTLRGWTQRNGTAKYAVQDGLIVGTTSQGSPNSFLCSDRDYSDFELSFEVWVDEKLNSGVQIRSRSLAQFKNGRVHGPQVEIDSGSEGSAGYVYSEGTDRGWLSQDRVKQGLFKTGEWNRYRVLARGARIQTWLNDVPIADLSDPESSRSGFIGLQVHSVPSGDGPYQVRWRNLLVRELH